MFYCYYLKKKCITFFSQAAPCTVSRAATRILTGVLSDLIQCDTLSTAVLASRCMLRNPLRAAKTCQYPHSQINVITINHPKPIVFWADVWFYADISYLIY